MVNQLRYLGIVVSKKMQKTATIVVKRPVYHPKMHVDINIRQKYLVHDEGEVCKLGDKVSIIPAKRRISKRKSWILEKIVRPVGQIEDFI